MTETEHLLVCLSEECDEIGQRVSKALRFGLSEIQPGQELNNAQRIEEEIADLEGVIEMLRQRGVLSRASDHDDRVATKIGKVIRFMGYARKQGTINP